MSGDIVERLRRVGDERQRTTAHDDPTHYLHVVAKISNADGLLMLEAADDIDRLVEGRDMMGDWWAKEKERADRLRARVKELEGALKRLRDVSRLALKLSQQHDDFKLYAMDPMWEALAAADRAALEDSKG